MTCFGTVEHRRSREIGDGSAQGVDCLRVDVADIIKLLALVNNRIHCREGRRFCNLIHCCLQVTRRERWCTQSSDTSETYLKILPYTSNTIKNLKPDRHPLQVIRRYSRRCKPYTEIHLRPLVFCRVQRGVYYSGPRLSWPSQRLLRKHPNQYACES